MNLRKKILVVGGTGFIGYHLAKKSLKKGWDVTSFSSNLPKRKRYLSRVKYIRCDITKKKFLKKKTNQHFDYVVNAGGYGKNPNFGKSGDILFKSHFFR